MEKGLYDALTETAQELEELGMMADAEPCESLWTARFNVKMRIDHLMSMSLPPSGDFDKLAGILDGMYLPLHEYGSFVESELTSLHREIQRILLLDAGVAEAA